MSRALIEALLICMCVKKNRLSLITDTHTLEIHSRKIMKNCTYVIFFPLKNHLLNLTFDFCWIIRTNQIVSVVSFMLWIYIDRRSTTKKTTYLIWVQLEFSYWGFFSPRFFVRTLQSIHLNDKLSIYTKLYTWRSQFNYNTNYRFWH